MKGNAKSLCLKLTKKKNKSMASYVFIIHDNDASRMLFRPKPSSHKKSYNN